MYSLFQKTMKDSKSQERLKKPKSINLQLASARQDRLNKLATSTSPNLLKSNT
jgi:hypothetical protein